ncbi:MAG: hypothetical protein GHCLOJNM_02608 [bacterium]|nr:hypothetical protein [bacterium]
MRILSSGPRKTSAGHSNRFYLDTSIWCFAVGEDCPDLRMITEEFFVHAEQNNWIILTSEIVLTEVANSPPPFRDHLERRIQQVAPTSIPVSERVLTLAEEYLRRNVLTEKHRFDALHVVAATLGNSDFLLSWNFRHLANYRREALFLDVNRDWGYDSPMRICTPAEVFEI